jgi:hypothetical protein
MAKGNIGNLLQHFVGLSCARRLVEMSAGKPIEYIDCYSMAPWEPTRGRNPQGFVSTVQQFEWMMAEGDFVARTFLTAWVGRYGKDAIPARPLDREYPNTAVLLRTAFPDQPWNMRLHDAEPTNRKDLEKWSQHQLLGTYRVEGDWIKSSLIQKAPMPQDTAVMVMLDPYQIVDDGNPKADEGGYLSKQLLRYLFGRLALNAHEREAAAGPCVNVLLSYSDAEPDDSDRVVREVFAQSKWVIERIQSGPWSVNGRPSYHQAWVVTKGVSSSLAPPTFQQAWDRWVFCVGDAENQEGK